LVDAFMWCLFGRDSLGQADFEIKTLDANGQPLSGVHHTVELTLDLGDDRTTFKRVLREKHERKRGSATEEYTGNTTDYYVDGVPVKKSEYDAHVAEILPSTVFRLLTDPNAFNALPWQKR